MTINGLLHVPVELDFVAHGHFLVYIVYILIHMDYCVLGMRTHVFTTVLPLLVQPSALFRDLACGATGYLTG